jgi:hypothetical protein
VTILTDPPTPTRGLPIAAVPAARPATDVVLKLGFATIAPARWVFVGPDVLLLGDHLPPTDLAQAITDGMAAAARSL